MLHIKGGKPAYGQVEISGDVYAAILIVADFLASKRKELLIENAPRCQLLLDFLDFIINIGVKVKWNSINEVSLKIDGQLNTDLSFPGEQNIYLKLIIPALFQREKEVSISIETANMIREEIRFYGSLGIRRNVFNGHVNLIAPLDTESPNQILRADRDDDIFGAGGKILLHRLFKNTRLVYNEHNPNLALLLNGSSAIKQDCPLSLIEFNFFAALGLLTNGDIEFVNYDLARYLNFLLKLVDFGASYEVIDNKLKLWYQKREFQSMYRLPHIALDELGYSLLISSVLSDHNVKLTVPQKEELEDLLKELNIINCRTDSAQVKGIPDVVDVVARPSKLSLVRNAFEVTPHLGVNMTMMAAAFVNDGRSWISHIEKIEYYNQSLLDNLSNLNLDISITTGN